MFGRRSLLWHLPQTVDDILAICSIGCHQQETFPVVCFGNNSRDCYCIDRDFGKKFQPMACFEFPWNIKTIVYFAIPGPTMAVCAQEN